MKRVHKPKHESAVSPVVGVMLMLVVTVIIAAVVSAFAGGLAETQKKTPQVTMTASYSQERGMYIYHEGGDTLAVGEFKFVLRPSSNYGSTLDGGLELKDIEQQFYVSEINMHLIEDSSGREWFNFRGQRVVPRFGPGDIAHISKENTATDKLTPNLELNFGWAGFNLGINNPGNIGSTFFLEMVTLDGKMIAVSEVQINP